MVVVYKIDVKKADHLKSNDLKWSAFLEIVSIIAVLGMQITQVQR